MKRSPYLNYLNSNIEWLGDVPSHWEVIKLKFIADVRSSNVDKHIKLDELPVYLCNYVDVYYNDYIDSNVEFMKGSATEDEIKRFGLLVGDVLLTKDSESWDDIAVPALVVENMKNLVCGYHLALIRPNIEKIYGEFLYRCFSSEVYNFQFQVSANGVTRYGLPVSSISNATIVLPPLDEQALICLYLKKEDERIFHIIEMLGGKESIDWVSEESMIGKLIGYKKALLNKVVTGRIRIA